MIYPIPNEKTTIRAGKFITNSLNTHSEVTYTRGNSGKPIYFNREILISRSGNIDISGITHTLSDMANEKLSGSYYGFIRISGSADILLEKCNLYTRKYNKSGRSTYDLAISNVVDGTFKNISSNDIYDSWRWGIVITDYSKNLVFEGCTLNRIDAHTGITNLTVKDCEIGSKGLTMTGSGLLNVINTEITANTFITLRADYGSTWSGKMNIVDCTYKPLAGSEPKLFMCEFFYDNDIIHDFGYDCKFPEAYIENLTIDNSSNTKYELVYIIYDNNKTLQDPVPLEYWPSEITINGYQFMNSENLSNPHFELIYSGANVSVSGFDGEKDGEYTANLQYDEKATDIVVNINAETIQQEKLLGDLDNDNKITILDVRLLLDVIINHSEIDLEVMDMNNDNKVDILDLRLLLDVVINQ